MSLTCFTVDTDEKEYAKELLKKYIANEGVDEVDFERTKELLTNFENDEKDDEELDEFVDEFDKKVANNLSKEFETFLEATKSNPSQVIRY